MAISRVIICVWWITFASQVHAIRYVMLVYILITWNILHLNKIKPRHLILPSYMIYCSSYTDDPCQDVSFGACTLDRYSIIKNGTQADSITCQEACNNLPGCKFFRYSDQFNLKCNLLSEDYRKYCDIIGGSLVGRLKITKPSTDNHEYILSIILSWYFV